MIKRSQSLPSVGKYNIGDPKKSKKDLKDQQHESHANFRPTIFGSINDATVNIGPGLYAIRNVCFSYYSERILKKPEIQYRTWAKETSLTAQNSQPLWLQSYALFLLNFLEKIIAKLNLSRFNKSTFLLISEIKFWIKDSHQDEVKKSRPSLQSDYKLG